MLTKKSIVVNTWLALVAMSFSGVACAGLYGDADKKVTIQPDGNGNYLIKGDAYLEGHWWYGDNKTLEIQGSLLEVAAPQGEPKLDQYVGNKASVKNDVKISSLGIKGQFQVGGTIEVNSLHVSGQLTDLTGQSVTNQVTVKDGLYVNVAKELTLGNLVANGDVVVSGGTLNVLGGQLGQEGQSLERISAENGSKIHLKGDVYTKNVNAVTAKDEVYIDGTLYLTGSNSTGAGTVHTSNLVFGQSGAWSQFDGLTMIVEHDAVLKGGTFGLLEGSTLNVGNALILQKDAFLQYQSKDKPWRINTLIFEKDSPQQDGLQTYGGALDIRTLHVKKAGRIDLYSKPALATPTSISVEKAVIADGASLAFSNSRVDNNDTNALAHVTIANLEMGKDATLENGVWKEANNPEKFRGGSHVVVTNLIGDGATITNHNSTLTIGADKNSQVVFNGTIDDKVDGVALTLNDASKWTVAGASHIAQLSLTGGVADVSKTNEDLSLANLTGTSGTVVMDAAKTNTVEVAKTDAKTHVEVKASETADKVTTDQASQMVGRLEGVTNKTGRVDEGMYQGAIAVDGAGHATQAKNSLMRDTLELASASTLSLNRILMNDVRKRLGDIRSLEANNGVWARYDGGKLEGDGTSNKFNTLHIGGDMAPFGDNAVRLGVSGSFTKGNVDYSRGSSDLDAYSLAAYGTWMADNGLFADVIARVAKAKSDMKVDGLYKGELNNTAYSLSGEMGWRFDLNDMFYAEPQVEATYTYIDSDKMTLKGNGEAYHYAVDSFDSFIGRVGVLAGMKCPAQKGDVYVRASMVHEFLGDATIRGGQASKLENDGKDTWVEYGVGANFNVMKNAYLWADIERTSGATVDEEWRGTVGVRYAF